MTEELGHKVEAGGGERLPFSGMEFVIRASADTTGGAFSIVEEISPVDVPAHVHHREDELFYVLEGDHVFTVGGVEYQAGPGDVIFGPKGVPHATQRVVPRVGRILAVFWPAGMEGFFRDLASAEGDGSLTPEKLDRIAEKYGAAWIEPEADR